MALQFALVATTAALRGTGNFKPGMVIQSAHAWCSTSLLAPVLIFGLGHRAAAGRGGRGAGLAGRDRRRRGGAGRATSCAPSATCRFVLARLPAPAGAVGADAQDRPAGGRGVRADGRLHGGRLHGQPALRRRGAGRLRHRPAGGAGRRSCRWWRWASPSARWPARTSAPACGDRVRETFRVAALMASGFMLVLTLLCQLVPERADRLLLRRSAGAGGGRRVPAHHLLNFVAAGIIFVSSSMFQALGNTLPAAGQLVRCASCWWRSPPTCCPGCPGSSCAGSGT